MNLPRLYSIQVENFRSLTKTEEVRLDAPVVLIHGANGAGKTSLLSAIELALTGEIPSMQRADSGYKQHLLKYGTEKGRIILKMVQEGELLLQTMQVDLTKKEPRFDRRLDQTLAQFFSERCFLAQSSLSQLLTIYQNPGTGIDSPLAAFVRELLGLDRLDALERGLESAMDIRNTRKQVPQFLTAERHRDALTDERLRAQGKENAAKALSDAALVELNVLLTHLGLGDDDFADPTFAVRLDDTKERAELSELADADRQLSSIERRHSLVTTLQATAERDVIERELSDSKSQLQQWRSQQGVEITELLHRASQIELVVSVADTDVASQLKTLEGFWSLEKARLTKIEEDDRTAAAKIHELEDQLANIEARIVNLDAQLGQVIGDVGLLSQALSAIVPHVHDPQCPVCMREFTEVSRQPLSEFVGNRIKELGDAAERQKNLTTERVNLERSKLAIQRDMSGWQAVVLLASQRQEVQSRLAQVQEIVVIAQRLVPEATSGANIIQRATSARQAFDKLASGSSEDAAIRADAMVLAETVGLDVVPQEPITKLLARCRERMALLTGTAAAKSESKSAARQRSDAYRQALGILHSASEDLSKALASEKVVTDALDAAEEIRKGLRYIVRVAGVARSEVIATVFNDRLNRIWRDLFVRLAPSEPFVPAFFPPPSGVRASSPILRTLYRAGGQGGAPGAMLSAGNLNTAALTLFLALHLAVHPKLPWLVLDDPVQSMDEVHISQFAALLRTLSKENNRQIFITVHDRALFDYLALELSPAFEGDQLITIEINASAEGATRITPTRRSFKPDTAIVPIAAE